ncbi:uncharacterized protein [Linepithema humile]|uniref:uncharacterized protein isoform X1 n=1 Tax=Linepithema humile TaxID=83485 RepID=UPI00351E5F41
MYTVVEFEDGILPVPSSRINTEKFICKWPPYSNADIERAIIDIDKVDKDWNTLPIVKVFGKSVHDLQTAKEKARLAQIVSDCDNDEHLKKSRHERKRKVVDSTDEDDDGDSQTKKINKNKSSRPKFSKMPTTLMSLNSRKNVLDNEMIIASDDDKNNKSTLRQNVGNIVHTLKKTVDVASTSQENNTQNCEMTKKLIYIIALEEENIKKSNAILQEMKEIRKIMINFSAKKYDPTVQSLEESMVNETNLNDLFPLNDSDELQAIEEKLENSAFKNDVMTLFAKRGGRNAYKITTNILSKAFTNKFACEFSYFGKQKKKALSKFKITKCIIETVMKCDRNIKEDELQRKIGNWLANAPQRVLRERIKKEKKKDEEKDNRKDDEQETDEGDDL